MKLSIKKFFILVFVLTSVHTLHSQVRNLGSLLDLASLDQKGLAIRLNENWIADAPTKEISKQGRLITTTYIYRQKSGSQIIQRIVVTNPSLNYKSVRTNLILNNSQLLAVIESGLPELEFEVRQNQPHKIVYHDGTNMVAITDEDYQDAPLSKGFFMISVFLH